MTPPQPDHVDDWAFRLTGFVDGEVDATQAVAIEAHLSTCPECRESVQMFRSVTRTIASDGVSWQMPSHVRAQILDALGREAASGERPQTLARGTRLLAWIRQWTFIPSVIALAASLVLFVLAPPANQTLQDQLIASHIHSLLAEHLTDVPSSDQHTVKPWFNGKTDFSPPVVDLATQGFPLVGGRLDYIDGRTVATAVYRRRKHVINLFMWPAQEIGEPKSGRQGYNILSWTANGITFCAVSDVSTDELQTLRQDLLQASAPEKEIQQSPP